MVLMTWGLRGAISEGILPATDQLWETKFLRIKEEEQLISMFLMYV